MMITYVIAAVFTVYVIVTIYVYVMNKAVNKVVREDLQEAIGKLQIELNDLEAKLQKELQIVTSQYDVANNSYLLSRKEYAELQAKLDLIKSTGKKLSNGCMMIPRLTTEKLEEDNVDNS